MRERSRAIVFHPQNWKEKKEKSEKKETRAETKNRVREMVPDAGKGTTVGALYGSKRGKEETGMHAGAQVLKVREPLAVFYLL